MSIVVVTVRSKESGHQDMKSYLGHVVCVVDFFGEVLHCSIYVCQKRLFIKNSNFF